MITIKLLQNYKGLIHTYPLYIKDKKSIIKDRVDDVSKNAHPCVNRDIKFAHNIYHNCSFHHRLTAS
jgi:hypothetical protein